jgi:predicted flap endonuclease-1-like 5' DNA nuclease
MEKNERIESEFDENNGNNEENIDQSNEEEEEEKETNKRKSKQIRIDMNAIPCIGSEEQEEELMALGITAYDQSVYEEGVMLQVDDALNYNKHNSNSNHVFQKVLALDSLNQSNIALNPIIQKQCSLSSETSSQLESEFENKTNFDNQMIASCSKTSFHQKSAQKFNHKNKISDDCSDSEDNYNEVDDEEWQPSEDDYKSEEEFELDDNYVNSDSDIELCDNNTNVKQRKGKESLKTTKKSLSKSNDLVFAKRSLRSKIIDDGNDKSYQKRIK